MSSEPKEGAPAIPYRLHSSRAAKFLCALSLLFTLWGAHRLTRLLPAPPAPGGGSGVVGGARPSEVPVELVFWYAWITCASTALGAAPFFLCRVRPGAGTALGASNAAAAGMMLAASASLAWEGLQGGGGGGGSLPPAGGVAAGAAAGVGAILASKRLLRNWGGAEGVFAGLAAADARRALLLVLVMFAHSATEGVAIGVGFTAGDAHVRGGGGGGGLGRFVALSLAIHNVPEGLATCLALVPNGTPPLEAALWALGTSLSQPLLAVVSFVFVHTFGVLLAPGLGFAAGAMTWVAVRELLPEAWEQLEGWGATRLAGIAGIVAAAGAGMVAMQALLAE
jgi:ZIP family zinc transporter